MSEINQIQVSKKLSRNMVLNKSRSDDLYGVTRLNLWGQGICDVSLVKDMPKLEIVSLTSNKLSSLQSFRHCPHIRELYLRKNNITKLEEIAYLKELSKLEKLWLSDNPCADCDNYRPTVLKTLPHLKYLDNIVVTDLERQEAEKDGVLLELLPDMEICDNSPSEYCSVDASNDDENGSGDSRLLISQNQDEENDFDSTEKVLFPKTAPKNPVSPNPEENLEEINRFRLELGLKPLPFSSFDPSVHAKHSQMQPRNNHEKDVRQAAFYLIKVLDKESLLFIGEAIATRLRNEFNDSSFGDVDSAKKD